MKKKLFSVLLSLAVLLSRLQIVAYAVEKESGAKEKVPKLQMCVISDVHIENENEKNRFISVLNDYNSIAPNYKVISVVGDFTNHGYVSEYMDFMKILNENANKTAEKIISMGNHEFYENSKYMNTDMGYKPLFDRFINMTKMPNTHYDKWIDGYHFISLCSEEARSNSSVNERIEIISQNEYTWLEKVIKEKASAKKPIFIFLHKPIKQTVFGSEKWGSEENSKRLVEILNKYPQVILFSGHSHYLLGNPKTVYQDGFTMVNTGAVAYTMDENEKVMWNSSHGLLVNVYNNEIEIKARDFTNHSWINTYKVKLPYKKCNN